MYTVLLADDEPSIREGMQDILDWGRLGFELTAVMDDGAPVISFLKDNTVDVIITDVKMAGQTGIDVARYVHENGVATKILLISGYKEVDLAMAAIRYNVVGYILKPIDITELEEQLTALRMQLEEETKIRRGEFDLAYYRRNLAELKNDFFQELAQGSFMSEKYLATVFQMLYPQADYRRCPCFLVTVTFTDFDRFLADRWYHTQSELYAALQNCVSLCDGPAAFGMIGKAKNTLRALGILTGGGGEEAENEAAAALCRAFRDCLTLGAEISPPERFGDILSLSRNRRENAGAGVSNEGRGEAAFGETPRQPGRVDDLLIERAKTYIIEHITEDISLEDVADRLYISQYYFSRTFKAKTGENLIDFIIAQKMEKAKELLREPRSKVYEISDKVGYSSKRYFTKVFKNHTGRTPSEYRSQYFLGQPLKTR